MRTLTIIKSFINKHKVVVWSAIFVLLSLSFILALVFTYQQANKSNNGAIVANGIECAEIGRDILSKGGSAVDSAIATLFCEGVTCPQSMGIGGGFVATIYTRHNKKVEAFIARETAPIKATYDMFVNRTVEGGLAVAVPGEVRGYWQLHQKYGNLEWKILIQPTIDLCRNGITVSRYLHNSLRKYEDIIMNETHNMKDIFVNPLTNTLWNEGEKMTRPILAKTLEIIAVEGESAIYNDGIIGRNLVEDVNDFGGILTIDDLKQFQTRWVEPVTSTLLGEYNLYTTPLPASGNILSFILNLINELYTEDEKLLLHRLVESFKHGYGQRTRCGDLEFEPNIHELVERLKTQDFINLIRTKIIDGKTNETYAYYGANFSNVEDHGTANMAVLAPNGDAITVTSTVNTIFGAKFRSKSTGIILNDEMDDFSTPGKDNAFGIPPSPANFIKPKKIPQSSMCPSIITDKNGDVRLLIGAAGGSKITTSVALAIIRHLYQHQSLYDAVQKPRLHHQLAPMLIQYEEEFNSDIMNYLNQTVGHQIQIIPPGNGFAALTAISVESQELIPVVDKRRRGSTAIYRSE